MYAVSGGHLGTVKELMKYEFLKYDHQNEVSESAIAFSMYRVDTKTK